jgi:dienelactone hydrolase
MPTRIGYGVSDGPDLETSGPCNNKDYPASLAPAISQVTAAVKYARSQSFIDPQRGILLGQSVGGFTAIGAAAENLPGVRLAINFAGGAGGNPKGRPGNPCQAERITATYGQLGTKTKIPTLWLYSSNDAYWGPDLPKKWATSFASHGGQAQFVELPPYGTDGHSIFTRNPAAWKPKLEAFLTKHRF